MLDFTKSNGSISKLVKNLLELVNNFLFAEKTIILPT